MNVSTLIFVYATWCKYCTATKPVIDQVEHALGSTILVERVDVDKQPAVAKRLRANSFPTIILRDTKGKMHRYEGERTFDQLVGWICDISDSCPTNVQSAW